MRRPQTSLSTKDIEAQKANAFAAELFIDHMPFKHEVFHKFTGKKSRDLACLVCNADNISPNDARALMEQFAGLDHVKAMFEGGAKAQHVALFLQAARVALQVQNPGAPALDATPPSLKNIVLQGPSGVGKTKMAQALGVAYVAEKRVPNPKVVMLKGLDLRGEFEGETPVVVNELMSFSEGGILIIDEADALGETDFYDEARDALNANMEFFNRQGGIVIMTVYGGGFNSLCASQPGLVGRFQTILDLPHYDESQIRLVLKKKIAMRSLVFDEEAEELACQELSKARDNLGDKFTNGRAVNDFVETILQMHAARFSPDCLQAVAEGTLPAPESLLIITKESVPNFDTKARAFVRNRQLLRAVL